MINMNLIYLGVIVLGLWVFDLGGNSVLYGNIVGVYSTGIVNLLYIFCWTDWSKIKQVQDVENMDQKSQICKKNDKNPNAEAVLKNTIENIEEDGTKIDTERPFTNQISFRNQDAESPDKMLRVRNETVNNASCKTLDDIKDPNANILKHEGRQESIV